MTRNKIGDSFSDLILLPTFMEKNIKIGAIRNEIISIMIFPLRTEIYSDLNS